jgi:ABC-type lipoprotein release transport system permease subunit
MKKIIKKRGNNGTGCIILGVNELKEHLEAEIGDTIDILRYKIIKKVKK